MRIAGPRLPSSPPPLAPLVRDPTPIPAPPLEIPRIHRPETSTGSRAADAALLGMAVGTAAAVITPAHAAPMDLALIVRDAVLPSGEAVSYELVSAGTVDLSAVVAPATSLIPLGADVGVGAPNHKSDVRAVQERLASLGFHVTPDGVLGSDTTRTIRVFEAMSTGAQQISNTAGRIRKGSPLHHLLSSPAAPRWEKIPASGPGFVNVDTDHHSYGSSRLVEVIRDAGLRYQSGHRAQNPGAALIATNDASKTLGGNTPDHESHEAGLDLDLRLPRKDGSSGALVGWSSYDRDAAYAMVAAFARDARVERVLIGDATLIARAVAKGETWASKVHNGGPSHRDHIHVDIKPMGLPVLGPTFSS